MSRTVSASVARCPSSGPKARTASPAAANCATQPAPTLVEAVRLAAGRLCLEASGNMRLERIAEVAATGVDYISAGALTHSARTLDLGLDF